MPRLNKAGPMGNGPVTGRGMGICTGTRNSGVFYGRGMGRNRNFGSRFGRGQGFGFNQNFRNAVTAFTPEKEKQYLKEQKEFFQS